MNLVASWSPLFAKGVRVLKRRVFGRAPRGVALSTARQVAPDFVLFFADPPANRYQIQQWLKPFEQLEGQWHTIIITMEVDTLRLLKGETTLPVIYCDRSRLIERVMEETSPKAVFYVNQNQANFRMLRFLEPRHVFLSHGESDKSYSVSNQIKAYDFAFVPGEAARERLSQLFGYDPSVRTKEVGRPAIEFFPREHRLERDEREVVLYAPTWEGDRGSMAYSSVVSHGERVVRALRDSGRFRIIYRPHPLLGA